MASRNLLKETRTFLRGLIAAHPDIITMGLQDKIYRELAPPGTDCPYIVMSFQSGRDRRALGTRALIFTRPLFLIRGVTEGTDDTLGNDIADAIEDALDGSSDLLAVDGVAKLTVGREEPIEFVEEEDGTRYNHIGGLYRVFVHYT
jgi:hypothetical protein